jgi:hypothetical protein
MKWRSQPFWIVRVDEKRRRQFRGGSRKARQDEYSGIDWILCGNVLLGDEVHAVTQRRDQSSARRRVKARKDAAAVGAVDVANRRSCDFAIGAIEAAGSLTAASGEWK